MAFGASVPTLTYTPTGFKNSETPSVLTGAPALSTTGTSSTPVGNYPITVAVGTLAAANYSFTFVNGTLAIGKSDVTVSWSNISANYDGSTHGITAIPAPAAAALTITYTDGASYNSTTPPTNAGNYTATATLTDTTNYKFAAAAQTTSPFTIAKADPTIDVTGYTGVYDGNAHGATGSAKGVKGETLSGLDLGASFTNVPSGTANWTFTDSTGNYNNKAGTAQITITKADPTIDVTGYTGVYDGNAHGATGSAKGVKVETLSGLDLGASFTDVPGGIANWTFTDVTGNYNNKAGTAQITITKATPVVHVSDVTATYDGNTHPATGSVTGVNNVPLGAATIAYTPGGTTDPTDAGTYAVVASYAGSTNYKAASANATVKIDKAPSTTVVTFEAGPYVYRASAFTATAVATGAGSLSQSVTPTYSGDCLNVSVANGCTASANFVGDLNHLSSGDSKSVTILKATANVQVSGYSNTYDAVAHGATGMATGVGNVSLPGLSLGATFTDVPGGTAHWIFAGGTNYNDQSGDVAIVIIKANASITVNGYTGTYDAAAHGANGSATGVGGVDLSAGLSLGATFTDYPGGTAYWSFAGGTNYNNDSGSVGIVISKADATVIVTGYSGVYDGNAHGATGDAKGVKGEALSGLDLGASFTNVPGGTAHWTFTGGTNYNNAAGDVPIVISKADAMVSVAGHTGIYDAAPHGATGSATGIDGAPISGLNLGATFTNVPGGTAHWVFNGGTNYNDQSGDVAITISKAGTVTVVTCGGPVSYNGSAQTPCSVSVTGVGLSLTPAPTYSNNVNAGIATASYTFAGDGNYDGSSDSKNFTINKAMVTATAGGYTGVYDAVAHTTSPCVISGEYKGDLTCTNNPASVGPDVIAGSVAPIATGTGLAENFTLTSISGAFNITPAPSVTAVVCPASVTYNGHAQTPCTASATGIGELNQVLSVSHTSNTNAGTAGASASYGGDSNHTGSSDSKTFLIAKATPTITVTGYNVIFDNVAHSATGSAKGVLGETLSGLNLSGTTHTLVGTFNDSWSFTDSTGNYNTATGTLSDSIGKWTLSGFYQPVTTYTGGTLVWNTVKGGSTVPVKFNIYAGTVQRTDVASVVGGSISLYGVNCDTHGIDDSVDEVVNTGNTMLRFDGSQFIQNWQTPKGAGQCFLVQMTALDGSKLQAYFKTK